MADFKPDWKGYPGNHIKMTIDDPNLDYVQAHALAKEKAREFGDDPMLLAWRQGRTGKTFPDVECGRDGKPGWILYAESRGADLAIDINDGDFIFIFITLY